MSREYEEYLADHIDFVRSGAKWLVEHLYSVIDLDASELSSFLYNVDRHDMSKYDPDEYEAYDAHFYGACDDDTFNLARIHHIHANKHHWQHWLLINHDGSWQDASKVTALEMPKIYALEMIADWWSFSWRKGDCGEIFEWYGKRKDDIVLHKSTREYVERVLDAMRQMLALGDEHPIKLEDAIEHAEQMAELAKWGPLEDEYKQQLGWLRELADLRRVSRMIWQHVEKTNCWECPYDVGCDTEIEPLGSKCRLAQEIRALGIGVD